MFGAASPWRPCMSQQPHRERYACMRGTLILYYTSPAGACFVLFAVEKCILRDARTTFCRRGEGSNRRILFHSAPTPGARENEIGRLYIKKKRLLYFSRERTTRFEPVPNVASALFIDAPTSIMYIRRCVRNSLTEVRWYKKFRKCINLLPSAAFGIFPNQIATSESYLFYVIIFY